MNSSRGFSLVELVVSTALTLGIAALVFAAVAPSESAFGTRTEQADLQQRLRVAADVLWRELDAAGAGPVTGEYQGPLSRAFAAIYPYRLGAPGLSGISARDVITIVSIPPTSAQTTIAIPYLAGTGTVVVHLDPGCPLAVPACGFADGMTAVMFDGAGAFDLFTVRAVFGSSITLEHASPPSGHSYPEGSGLVEAQVHVFSRRTDAAGVEQLTRENGIGGTAVPVIDHLVDLSFTYAGDPLPPTIRAALADEPATTYGPVPPLAGVQTSAYPPGENCVFSFAGVHVPRLPALVPDAGGLTSLTDASLTDGPWCPDASHPLRFDADLLRIRQVSASVRVQAALTSLRGPAGVLFARPGTSSNATRWLPDLETVVVASPPNLKLLFRP